MRKLALLLFLFSMTVNAQIYVQAVGYWDNNEKYEYEGSYQKYKVKDKDTIYEVDYSYDIVVKVTDSTANSYTVEWTYKNNKFIKGNKIASLLSNPNDSIKIVFKTDELGAFKELLNIEELKEYYDNKFNELEKQLKEPEHLAIIQNLRQQFKNESYIKNNSYRDLLNYYTFHGGKYELNEEYDGTLKTANNNGGEPFDTAVNVWLDEVDSENNNFILRSYQKIDTNQLKKAVAKRLGVSEDEIPEITNETYIVNRIHGTGWTTYSNMIREVKSENDKNVEEFTIIIK